MRLGVFSDVHGNRHALEAVVADGADRGVDRWWALGDLTAIGPDPVGVLEVVGNLPDCVATYGNTERYTLTEDRPFPHAADVVEDPGLLPLFAQVAASFSWTRGALEATGWLPWVADLPLEVRVDLPDGARVLGVHASPGRDDGAGIQPQLPDDDLRRTLAGADAEVVIAGHTHRATDRTVDGVRAVNGGCVSNPITDDPRPSYTIVHADRDGHQVEHRRVTYDRDAFLAAVRASAHPAKDYIASFQRGEQVRHPSKIPGAPACDD